MPAKEEGRTPEATTFTIDIDIKEKFKKFCSDRNKFLSKTVEQAMEEFLDRNEG